MTAEPTREDVRKRTLPQGLTADLRLARQQQPTADPATREAVGRLYQHLQKQFERYLKAQAARVWDNALSTQDLFHDVFFEMLENGFPYNDTDHFRQEFCRRVWGRRTDFIRRRRRQQDAMPREETIPDDDNRKAAYEAVEALDVVLAKLDNAHPDWAEVVRLRFLAEPPRSDAPGAEGPGWAERPDRTADTWEAIAGFLGVAKATAHERCANAQRWLNEHYPELGRGGG